MNIELEKYRIDAEARVAIEKHKQEIDAETERLKQKIDAETERHRIDTEASLKIQEVEADVEKERIEERKCKLQLELEIVREERKILQLKRHLPQSTTSKAEFFDAQSIPVVDLPIFRLPEEVFELKVATTKFPQGQASEKLFRADLVSSVNKTNFMDTHAKHVFQMSDFRPDFCVFVPNCSFHVFHIVVLGEAKKGDLDNSDRGQLLDYLVRLLRDEHPFRSFIYGFLVCPNSIEFYKATRQPDETITFQRSVSFPSSSKSGFGRLLHLISCDNLVDLGYALPSPFLRGTRLVLAGCLGSGSFGTVFFTQDNRVVKVQASAEKAAAELACLKALKDIPGVPTKAEQTDDLLGIVMEPLCRQIVTRPVYFISEVIDTLQHVHSRGWVHRDLRDSNLLVGPMGTVFLVDFGSATQASVPAVFEGCVSCGALAVVLHMSGNPRAPFIYDRVHDLLGLVNLCLSHIVPGLKDELDKLKLHKDYSQLAQVWKDILDRPCYQPLVVAAHDSVALGDYSILKNCMKQYMWK